MKQKTFYKLSTFFLFVLFQATTLSISANDSNLKKRKREEASKEEKRFRLAEHSSEILDILETCHNDPLVQKSFPTELMKKLKEAQNKLGPVGREYKNQLKEIFFRVLAKMSQVNVPDSKGRQEEESGGGQGISCSGKNPPWKVSIEGLSSSIFLMGEDNLKTIFENNERLFQEMKEFYPKLNIQLSPMDRFPVYRANNGNYDFNSSLLEN